MLSRRRLGWFIICTVALWVGGILCLRYDGVRAGLMRGWHRAVFTNKYGKNSFLNLDNVFVWMMILPGVCRHDCQLARPLDLCWTIASLSFVLFVQYFCTWYYSHGLYKSRAHFNQNSSVWQGQRYSVCLRAAFRWRWAFTVYLVTIIVTSHMPICWRRFERIDINFGASRWENLLHNYKSRWNDLWSLPFHAQDLYAWFLWSLLIVACLLICYFSVLKSQHRRTQIRMECS